MEFIEDGEIFVDQRNEEKIIEENYYEDDTFKNFGEDMGSEEDLHIEARI